MKEKLTIVKIGGAILENETALDDLLAAFVQLEEKKLLVHGGGIIATQLARDLGMKEEKIEGRRITNDQMLDVVVMTYGGLLNKKLVAKLQAKSENSMGLTGADANCMLAVKRPVKNGIDYGWVGDIISVNDSILSELLKKGIIPVLAPLTHDGQGHLLNTNADTIASEVAIALSKHFDVQLNFIFDQKGVMKDIKDPESLIKSMDRSKYQELKEIGAITDGMIPKLDNAFRTIQQGVSLVRLLNSQALSQLQNPDFDEYTSIH